MPRRPRHFLPDTIYHVTDRGVDRRPIFLTEDDKQYFMQLLLGDLKSARCSLLADCLMPNHFHALIAVSDIPLGIPFHATLTKYSAKFNASNSRSGHLFQSRFYSTPVSSISYLQNIIAYIHENPLRAKLVPSVCDWKWSSHHDWATLSPGKIDFMRIEELTGVSVPELRDAYLERVKLMAAGGPRGLDLKGLIADTAYMLGLDPRGLMAGQRGAIKTRARNMIINRALAGGYSAIQIAAALNCTPAAVTMARKRQAIR
jgi:REP element-mobilizing transposase RayT/DNA-binding CsgD family transcriptional regulator